MNTQRDATAKNRLAKKSTVSASKQILNVGLIVSASSARMERNPNRIAMREDPSTRQRRKGECKNFDEGLKN